MAPRHHLRRPRVRNVRSSRRGDLRFDSQKEARRYDDLVVARDAGHVVQFLRQVPFDLPGGVKYRVDFVVFWSGGTVTFEDVKGHSTELYRLKKKQVESLYHPIEITEIR